MKEEIEGKELVFIHYMESDLSSHEVDEAVKCVCLHCAAAGSAEEEHDAEKVRRDREAVAAGEWFEPVPFQGFVGTVHVVWAAIAAHPFARALHWSSHRFYVNNFSNTLRWREAEYMSRRDSTGGSFL